MARQLLIPNLGENIESVVVAGILIEAGDTVQADQSLLELESDKAVLEVPAEEAGTIEQILVSKGDTVTIGQPFAELSTSGSPSEPATAGAEAPTPETAPTPLSSEPSPEAVDGVQLPFL